MPGKPMDPMTIRKNHADDAEVHIRDAADLCGTVASALEEAGNDGSAWEDASNELRSLLERVRRLAR